MSKNYLEIKNVSFIAGGKTKVRNVSFNIENKGDIICLLGPSGVGKTTILRTIAGLEKIKSGSIKLTLSLKIEIYHFHFKKIVYFHIIQKKKIFTLERKEKIQIKKRK